MKPINKLLIILKSCRSESFNFPFRFPPITKSISHLNDVIWNLIDGKVYVISNEHIKSFLYLMSRWFASRSHTCRLYLGIFRVSIKSDENCWTLRQNSINKQINHFWLKRWKRGNFYTRRNSLVRILKRTSQLFTQSWMNVYHELVTDTNHCKTQ